MLDRGAASRRQEVARDLGAFGLDERSNSLARSEAEDL
jgi:hypothetical protein